MKKIINGKKYDTSTATCLAQWTNGYLREDFYFLEESLYCKRTGEYYLYGLGGAKTRYSVYCYNYYCGGEDIIPLTDDDAREWCVKHCDADTYEAIWGPVPE